ncbi:transcription factor HES-5-like [Arapaima gigas]
MAPCSYTSELGDLKLSNKEKNKLRKPVVEKMRRDRINGCIEQLRKLLEKEFQQHDPSAKLEKADILEMTVSFLKKHLQPRAAGTVRAYSEGYTQCWKETLCFLSASSRGVVPLHHLRRFHDSQTTGKQLSPVSPVGSTQSAVQVKQEPGAEGPIWRPW